MKAVRFMMHAFWRFMPYIHDFLNANFMTKVLWLSKWYIMEVHRWWTKKIVCSWNWKHFISFLAFKCDLMVGAKRNVLCFANQECVVWQIWIEYGCKAGYGTEFYLGFLKILNKISTISMIFKILLSINDLLCLRFKSTLMKI